MHAHHRGSASKPVEPLDIDAADEPDRRSETSAQRFTGWQDEMIGQLPEKYQQALRLAEIEGLPPWAIADRLGLSLSGAKSRIQRGRALLKRELEACCRFEFDRRGNLMDVIPKPGRCGCDRCDA